MKRHIWTPALALGAVFALAGAAGADERDTMRLSGGTKFSATTMTLGGTGTAAQAATEDTELTHGGRYRGYYGWGGGWGGYRGYYGGYYPRSVVSFNFYRPAYYGGWGGYYRPAYYYTPRVYYPSYPIYSGYYGGYGCSSGFYIGISGGTGTGAATMQLGGNFAPPTQPMTKPTAPDGTFRYDGGPANPVPLPKTDPAPIPPAIPDATDLPISGKAKPTPSPYRYKAYGEK